MYDGDAQVEALNENVFPQEALMVVEDVDHVVISRKFDLSPMFQSRRISTENGQPIPTVNYIMHMYNLFRFNWNDSRL
jgi:hypothetical protein